MVIIGRGEERQDLKEGSRSREDCAVTLPH